MKIIVVGVGETSRVEKEKLKTTAGIKGAVLLYLNLARFSQSLDKLLEGMYGKDLLLYLCTPLKVIWSYSPSFNVPVTRLPKVGSFGMSGIVPYVRKLGLGKVRSYLT